MKADNETFTDLGPQHAQPKRAQVPRACSNCRKMHAGCDTQRPCRRCKQNGLEATCVDIPRKKRASRKKQKGEQQPTESQVSSNQVQQSPQSGLSSSPSQRSWENTVLHEQTYQPTQNQSGESFENITSSMSPLFNPDYNVGNYHPPITPQGLHNEYSDFGHTGLTPSPIGSNNSNLTPNNMKDMNMSNVTNMGMNMSMNMNSMSNSPSMNHHLNSSPSSGDISYLLQQINELRESNSNLENKLVSVTSELGEMKCKKAQHSSTPWHSFQPQQDLAISVWKNVGYSSNVLVECNTKFVELLGYPLDTLKNNFTCAKLIRKDAADPYKSSGRDWPKRTQIVTAEGLKDVFITINPVSDGHNVVKYYVLHILEVHA